MSLVEKTLDLIEAWKPKVWALENPLSGRMAKLCPRLQAVPVWSFHPFQFAGWAEDPKAEAHGKGTRIWGTSTRPEERPVERWDTNLGREGATRQTAISWMSPGPERANQRSKTPSGFARAFYAANVAKVLG